MTPRAQRHEGWTLVRNIGSILFAIAFIAMGLMFVRCDARAACIPLPICADNGNVSPCATPTPTFQWDQVADLDLAGYSLYYNEPGGVPQLLVDLPCEWYDVNQDGTPDTRACRGADFGIPAQRYCQSCQPFTDYEFRVKAYDIEGTRSIGFSTIDHACFSPLCVGTGPCD
jgi:hypothetical protein